MISGEYIRLLAEAFDFTTDDLTENQAGTVSLRQKKLLKPSFPWYVGLLIVFIIGFGSIALGYFNPADLLGSHQDIKFYGLGVFILVLGVIGSLFDRFSGKVMQKGQVSVIRGPVTLKTIRFGDTVEFTAKIERQTFTVTEEQSQMLRDGQVYCFYYVRGSYPRMKKILSVEALSLPHSPTR